MDKETICDIIEKINIIRMLGLCNMLDVNCVVSLLREFGYNDIASWIIENINEYAKLVMTGRLMNIHYTECIEE